MPLSGLYLLVLSVWWLHVYTVGSTNLYRPVIRQEFSRRGEGHSYVLLGGKHDAGQDMRWQRCGSSTLCLEVTLYLSENKNIQTPVFNSSSKTHNGEQMKRGRGEAVAHCPGATTYQLLGLCSVRVKAAMTTNTSQSQISTSWLHLVSVCSQE